MNPDFFDAARKELARANTIHPPFRSLHEGYAVLLEEIDELWDEIRRRGHRRPRVQAECVQIAAMAGKVVAFLEATAPEPVAEPEGLEVVDLAAELLARQGAYAVLDPTSHAPRPSVTQLAVWVVQALDAHATATARVAELQEEVERLRNSRKLSFQRENKKWMENKRLRAKVAELEAREVTGPVAEPEGLEVVAGAVRDTREGVVRLVGPPPYREGYELLTPHATATALLDAKDAEIERLDMERSDFRDAWEMNEAENECLRAQFAELEAREVTGEMVYAGIKAINPSDNINPHWCEEFAEKINAALRSPATEEAP